MPLTVLRWPRLALPSALVLGTVALGLPASDAEAARRPRDRATAEQTSQTVSNGTPEIRTSASNKVPACIKPDRLMRVLTERNDKLESRFQTIATEYKRHGEALGVRWDYAFYQMVLETNYLAFKRGDGKSGDVKARQNNFAGIGATGGGVPGESYPDVSTGVLAQIQHLSAYSGDRVENPVAPRTRENQDSIIAKSKRLGRAVRFADLTNRWAADRNYARSIEAVADRFHQAACNGQPQDEPAIAAAPANAPKIAEAKPDKPRGRDLARKAIEDGRNETGPKVGLGAIKVPLATSGCSVLAASFGGSVTLLIRAESPKGISFTALGVEGGSEDAMAESYIKTHADGGKVAGRFKSRDAAIAHAYNLCDSGKP
jgi:hypothetical protein